MCMYLKIQHKNEAKMTIQGEIDKTTTVVENFKTSFSIIVELDRKSEYRLITINWHSRNTPITEEYTSFSSIHSIITKMDHVLSHAAIILMN